MEAGDLAKKLQIKQGYKLAVLDAPPGYIEKLGVPADTALTGKSDGALDFVQTFIKTLAELNDRVPAAQRALKPDGLFWVSYPKGGSKVKTDLNRDIIWREVGKFGLTGVALVSLDETWSAMRIRPTEKVGK